MPLPIGRFVQALFPSFAPTFYHCESWKPKLALPPPLSVHICTYTLPVHCNRIISPIFSLFEPKDVEAYKFFQANAAEHLQMLCVQKIALIYFENYYPYPSLPNSVGVLVLHLRFNLALVKLDVRFNT